MEPISSQIVPKQLDQVFFAMLDMKQALLALAQKQSLSKVESHSLMQNILCNHYSPVQVSAFLMGLRAKGESLDEVIGAAEAVQEKMAAHSVELPHFVQVASTGHDGAEIFNLSVASAFVAAAAGSHVALHDGSPFIISTKNADLLRAFGIKTSAEPEQAIKFLSETGLGFTLGVLDEFKLNLDSSNELGFSNLFNLMGAIASPFKTKRHFIGVQDFSLCRKFAELLAQLGSEQALIVHGADGLDAISLSGKTYVAEWINGQFLEYEISPEDFGIQSKSLMGLNQAAVEDAHLLIKDALGNRRGHYAEKAADMITLNAGGVIYSSGLAESLKQGVSMAREVIANSRAGDKIRQASSYSI